MPLGVRYEFKYLLSMRSYFIIKGIVSEFMGSDKHSTERSYPVLSLYFDSADSEYYHQKIQGEHLHVKVRLRKYSDHFFDEASGFLEMKTSINSRQSKIRVPQKDMGRVMTPDFWQSEVDLAFFKEYQLKRFTPKCFVHYRREAYEQEFEGGNKLRITFDHDVSAWPLNSCFEERQAIYGASCSHRVIMEIKYPQAQFPLWLQQLLQQFSLKREHISKYADGLTKISS